MESVTKKSQSDLMERLFDLLIAWFPAFVAFILIPFAVYLPNQKEFSHDLAYVTPFIMAALVSLLLLIPILFLHASVRIKIGVVLFYIGIYLALDDIIAPLRVGSLMNGPEQVIPQEAGFRDVASALLLIAVVVIGIKLPMEKVRRWARAFVFLVVLVEAGHVVHNLSPETVIPWVGTRNRQAAEPKSIATSGNIYQVCFDALSGLAFLDAVRELGMESEFDGFTFFRNNRSNYIFTMESMPSYFTGTFFGGGSYSDWDQNRVKSGMVKHLHDVGYRISMYVPGTDYLHEHASQQITPVALRQRSEIRFHRYDFADLCLLRLAPPFTEQWVYDANGKGIFRRLIGETASSRITESQCTGQKPSDAPSCVPIIGEMLSEEDQRPDHGQYIYAHTLVTHGPWGRRNSNCRYMPEGGGTYFDHALCGVNLMVALITKLKKLGRYKEATIIFQSDHGAEPMSPQTKEYRSMPTNVGKGITSVTGLSPAYFRDRTFGFLLIKPAGESGIPLKVSESPTQLADIPATVYEILNLPLKTEAGSSVFSLKASEEREIHMFTGFVKLNAQGRLVFAGKQIFDGSICHVSYTNGKGWKLYPDIPWKWK